MAQTFINKVGWYDMLTLDHKVCRVCFNQPHVANQTPTARSLALAEGRPLNDSSRAAYMLSLRAWLKRHIASQHPEWIPNVRWTKEVKR